MTTNAHLYEQDFFGWTQTTAALIRAGKWYDIAPEVLAEEVESLGKSQQNALESRLEKLVLHLLKWRYQSEKRGSGQSWQRTILEQRWRIGRLLQQNPSLRPTVPTVLAESYAYILRRTSLETRLPLVTFPETCPWTLEQILDDHFWPEAAVESRPLTPPG
jgi:hypothetical protein